MKTGLDEYDLRARLAPALVVVCPLVLTPYALNPDLKSLLGALGGVLISLGISALLMALVRQQGKRVEAKLFHLWGGAPATAMLRHRDMRISAATKEKLHNCLRKEAANFSVPTLEMEQSNPGCADAIYDSIVNWLKQKTRSKTNFPLVFSENAAYGFARNVYALKPIAILFGFLALTIEMLAWAFIGIENLTFFLVIAVLQGLLLIFWIFGINVETVRVPAEGYAKALLECCWGLRQEGQIP